MLVDFRIKNFALIDELEINFTKGLNVLTGETGAGKSIVIEALEILLGARASTELIRKGKESAYIEAAFKPTHINLINQKLKKAGIETDPQLTLLSRELRQNGNNRNRINGQLATASMIKDISKYLVDIHGQHEHQRLLDNSSQLRLLDDFIAFDELTLKSKVKELYNKIYEIEEKLADFDIDESKKAREIDLLKFQIDEIEKAQLKDNEIEELGKKFKILTNIEEIYAVVGDIYSKLKGDDYSDISGFLNQFAIFMKNLGDLIEYDEELDDYHDMITDIFYQIEDFSFRLNEYLEKLEFDQEKLDKVEKRLSLLTDLQRKYGKSVEDIRNFLDKIQNRLESLESQEILLNELKEKKEEILNEYYENAEKLSKIRQNKANELEKVIAAELNDLAMNNTIFEISFSKKNPSIDGIDKVEFLISPNPGEDLKPLSKIASGGELSRIMLALKTIIAHVDQVDTLIFDEVDTGVGGKVAQMMADKLALIGKKRQVLCITHLAQIASMGDNHFFIKKEQAENRTFTKIYNLDKKERKKELARMLGGVELTDTVIKHVEEMVRLADNKKAELL